MRPASYREVDSTMSTPAIEIRPLEQIEEYHQAEQLQRLAWHMDDDLEVTPLHLLVTMQKNGGLVLGAFEGARMIGFLCGFIGRTPDGAIKHCSHQMATLPDYQRHGVGQRLKWFQREWVLQQGINWITWTYDPLETVNGYLNIVKLGAVCHTYLRNVYGDLTDALNKGLPTDRFQVDWWLDSQRVASAREGNGPTPRTLPEALALGAEIVNPVFFRDGLPDPQGWQRLDLPLLLVEVPAHFQAVKVRSFEAARAWRALTHEIFAGYFQAGHSVTNLIRHQDEGGERCFYLLEPTHDLPQQKA